LIRRSSHFAFANLTDLLFWLVNIPSKKLKCLGNTGLEFLHCYSQTKYT
jgi:hypothetical protein